MFAPKIGYNTSSVQISKKGRKDYCGGGFTLDDLNLSHFRNFNQGLQKLIQQFVIGTNKAIINGDIELSIENKISTFDKWKEKFYEDSKFEREYFPQAVETLQKVSSLIHNNSKIQSKLEQKVWSLIYQGIKEGGSSWMPGTTSKAYHNLLFAAGYIAGLECDKSCPFSNKDISDVGISVFNTTVNLILKDKRDPYFNELLRESKTLDHDRKSYVLGLKYGLMNENHQSVSRWFLNPDPMRIRTWRS